MVIKQDYSLVGKDGEGFMDLERVETRELAPLPKVWEDFPKEAGFFKVIWKISYPLTVVLSPFFLERLCHTILCNFETRADQTCSACFLSTHFT